MIVLTKCHKDETPALLKESELMVGRGNVIQTLAKEYKTRIKNPETGEALVIAPFGLDFVYGNVRGKDT